MAANTTRPVGKKPDEAPTWIGPFDETDEHGDRTGAAYVRCRSCDVEVLVRDRATATHRPECSSRGET